MAKDIRKIKEAIAQLMRIATDPNASEGEAASAMKRAHAMPEKYGLTADELKEASEDTFTSSNIPLTPKGHMHPVWRMLSIPVSNFVGCRVMMKADTAVTSEGGSQFYFVGTEADVEFANWLLHSFHDAMEKGWKNYTKYRMAAGNKQTIKMRRKQFTTGFGDVMRARLRDWGMRAEGSGTSLVPVKQKVSTEYGVERDFVEPITSAGSRAEGGDAGAAGSQAASNASTGRGMGRGVAAITYSGGK